jgi:hypothetical protein
MPVVPCTNAQPVFGVVDYSAAEFLASYPEFTGINNASPQSLANDFAGATFLLNNSCQSRVRDANQRLFLLYLLTAHIATIFQGVNDAGIGSPAFAGSVSLSAGTPGGLAVLTVTQGALAVGASLFDGPGVGPGNVSPGSVVVASQTSGTPGGVGLYVLTAASGTLAAENMIVPGIPNVSAPLGIVGRINNASEGDVSVSSEWSAPPNANQAYFVQTKYGAQYWTMTAKYRTAIFLPAPSGAYNPFAGYGIGPWGPGGPRGF